MTITYVGERYAIANSGAQSPSFSPASNGTAGNLMVLILAGSGSGVVSSVSDNAGNTWVIDATYNDGGNEDMVCIASCYQKFAITTSTTVTATCPGTMTIGPILLEEFSGVYVKDVTVTNPGSTSSVSSGTTAATAVATELAIAAWSIAGVPSAFTVGTGYSRFTTSLQSSSSDNSLGCEYQILSATGTQTATGTFTGGSNSAGALVCYQPAPLQVTPNQDFYDNFPP